MVLMAPRSLETLEALNNIQDLTSTEKMSLVTVYAMNFVIRGYGLITVVSIRMYRCYKNIDEEVASALEEVEGDRDAPS